MPGTLPSTQQETLPPAPAPGADGDRRSDGQATSMLVQPGGAGGQAWRPEWRRLARRLQRSSRRILEAWYETQFVAERLARYQVQGVEGLKRAFVSEHFLRPLLGLLIAYLRTGESRYRDLYLDERLRYAPHRADPGVQRQFFGEVIPADEDALLAAMDGRVERETLSAILRGLHDSLTQAPKGKAVSLLAVGDCVLNEVRVFLRPRCAERGMPLDMRCVFFSSVVGRELSSKEVEAEMAGTRFDLLTFSFFTYEGLPPYAALMREADRLTPAELEGRAAQLVDLAAGYLNKVRDRTDAPILLHNVSGLPLTRYRKRLPLVPALSRGRRCVVDALNAGLERLADVLPNVLLVDERGVAQTYGLRAAARSAVPRRLERGGYFHTARLGDPLADAYADIIASYQDLRKAKVLLVDFDHTLWEGVMADGPVRHRLEAQRLLRRLKDVGILLVALSKNDVKNVRWDEMALRPDDFVLLKVNWNLKVQSIEEAAAELDLGLDTFVLLDDSAEERSLVQARFSQIPALDPADPRTWISLERMFRFPNTRATDEARTRTELYRAQAQRHDAQRSAAPGVDYPAMMASLGLRLRFGRATPKDLDRLTELVQRTNQFNTTTIRYTRDELARFLSGSDRGVYVAELIDRFGTFGLVAVAVTARGDSKLAIESFVMSCRAMGFGLEQALLRLVLDEERSAGPVAGRFVPTDRNSPAARLFADNGFTQVSPELWVLEDPRLGPQLPAWFTVAKRS